jgi:hypothetical protein
LPVSPPNDRMAGKTEAELKFNFGSKAAFVKKPAI